MLAWRCRETGRSGWIVKGVPYIFFAFFLLLSRGDRPGRPLFPCAPCHRWLEKKRNKWPITCGGTGTTPAVCDATPFVREGGFENGVEWEIKSPTGNSKRTIETQFSRASRQAKDIILDMRRTKLNDSYIERQVLIEIQKRHTIRRVIIINKSNKVIDIKK